MRPGAGTNRCCVFGFTAVNPRNCSARRDASSVASAGICPDDDGGADWNSYPLTVGAFTAVNRLPLLTQPPEGRQSRLLLVGGFEGTIAAREWSWNENSVWVRSRILSP